MFSCEYCEIFKDISFKGHLWTTASEQWRRKSRDVFRDGNRRRIQSPFKFLRRIFLQKQLTVFNHWLFLQNTSYYLFHREYALIKLNKILVPEVVTRKCSVKKVFLESLRPATLFRKILWDRCFAVNFANFLKTFFLTEHL